MSAIYGFSRLEVAVVTGGATGIGAALSELLLAQGVSVVVLHHPATSPPNDGTARYLSCDVRDEVGVHETLSTVVATYGRIDMLANVAALVGLGVEAPLLEHSTHLFRSVIETNLVGQFIVLRECANQMVRLGIAGRVVNVASVRGHLGGERIAGYVAAKSGLIGLTRAAALELAPHGIRVNAVAPGFIATEKAVAEEDAAEPLAFPKKTPLARYGQPLDAARVIAALLSADSAFVTGSIWDIDGGARTY